MCVRRLSRKRRNTRVGTKPRIGAFIVLYMDETQPGFQHLKINHLIEPLNASLPANEKGSIPLRL